MGTQRKLPVDKPEPPVGEKFGYARVSTDDQDLRMQLEALARAGVELHRIYEDKKSGATLKRGGLLDCLEMMRRGDVLVVWRFDRLSRSLRDLLKVFDELQERGIALRSIHEQLDTTTPMGKLMFQLAGMLAEFERNLISARTSLGMQTAKAHGRKFGPARVLTDAQIDAAIKWLTPRRHLKGQVPIVLQRLRKRGVQIGDDTLRNRILERTGGKRLWPKGPNNKT